MRCIKAMAASFQAAVAWVNARRQQDDMRNASKQHIFMHQSMLLRIYALYKQGTQGDCTGSRPSMFDPVNRAKWYAIFTFDVHTFAGGA